MNYSTHVVKFKVFGEKLDKFDLFIPMYVGLGLFQMQVCLIWQKGDPFRTYSLFSIKYP